MNNPYFDVLYDYCCMAIENVELSGEYPFDIYLYLKDKIPLDEYNMLCEHLCEKIEYRHDDLICTISDIGIKIDIEDDYNNDERFNIKEREEDKSDAIVIDAYIHDKEKHLYVMRNTNFILYKYENECYFTGKLVDGENVPLDEDDLIVANRTPIKVKL